MFLGVLNTVFLNLSNYLAHLELKNLFIQIVIIMNVVGIKRFDCIIYHIGKFTLCFFFPGLYKCG